MKQIGEKVITRIGNGPNQTGNLIFSPILFQKPDKDNRGEILKMFLISGFTTQQQFEAVRYNLCSMRLERST